MIWLAVIGALCLILAFLAIDYAIELGKARQRIAHLEAEKTALALTLKKGIFTRYHLNRSVDETKLALEASAYPREHVDDVVLLLRDVETTRISSKWTRPIGKNW